MLYAKSVYVSVWFVKPPKPNPPEEETDEEKGLRRLFEQIAGSVRNWKLQSNVYCWVSQRELQGADGKLMTN